MSPRVRQSLDLVERLGLSLALALPVALWKARFHVLATTEGSWRGVSDPPSWWHVAAASALGLVGSLLLWRCGPRVRRPALVFLLLLAPAVPILTGRGTALLAFQGPVVLFLAVGAVAWALCEAGVLGKDVPAPRTWIIFVASLAVGIPAAVLLPRVGGPQGDEPHYLLLTQSLLTDADVDLADEFASSDFRAFYPGELAPHRSPASPPGHVLSVHTPGLPALLVPAYGLAGYLGVRFFLACLAAITATLVWRCASEWIGPGWPALWAWVAFTFTPPFFYYAPLAYPETVAALCVASFVLAAAPSASSVRVVVAAVAAAMLPWLHPKFLPLAVLGAGLCLILPVRWRVRIVVVSALAVSVGLLLVYFKLLYGRAVLSAAYGAGFDADVSLWHLPRGLGGLLFDRQYGMLFVAPIWIAGLGGLWQLARWRPREGTFLIAVVAAVIGMGATFEMWWGGSCPPTRFVVAALPALAVGVALVARQRPRVVAAAVALGLALSAAALVDPHLIHTRAHHEGAFMRWLWPWADLQGALPSFALAEAGASWLAATLAATLLVAWRWGWRGLAVGGMVYVTLAGVTRTRPLVHPTRSAAGALALWDGTNFRGVSGGFRPSEMAIPLDLPSGPWRLTEGAWHRSRRIGLPPGRYVLHIDVGASKEPMGESLVEVSNADDVLARVRLHPRRRSVTLSLDLARGAKRLAMSARGEGGSIVRAAWLRPQFVVPRSRRGG